MYTNVNVRQIQRIVKDALRLYEAQQSGTPTTIHHEPIQQMENLANDIIDQIRTLIDMLATPYRLWNDGGVEELVISAENTDEAPAGSQYTQRWWYQAQCVFNAFRIWYSTPLSTLSQLSAEIEGETIQPFAFLAQAPIDGDLTPLKIISTKPEIANANEEDDNDE